MIRRPPRSTLFPLHDALPIYTRRGLHVLAVASEVGIRKEAQLQVLEIVADKSDLPPFARANEELDYAIHLSIAQLVPIGYSGGERTDSSF